LFHMRGVGPSPLRTAIISAVVLWLGFILSTLMVNYSFARRPRVLIAIDGGHWLAVMLVMAVILGLMGVLALPGAPGQILICGGGLGGLTAALALARHGRLSRVLEGAPEFGAIGYGIQFGPNVFHVFHRLGLTEAVMAKADCPPAVLMRDAFT